MELQPDPGNPNKPEKRKIEEDEEPAQELGDGDYETRSLKSPMRKESDNLDSVVRRQSAERDPVRVHDIIIIRDNIRTKDAIESEVEELLRGATTFQELWHAAGVAEELLGGLGIFESVNVRVDDGPPDLPGTANVIVEVSELSNLFAGKLRSYTKYGGDIWDASVRKRYRLRVVLPRILIPLTGKIFLLSQDWLNFTSYKERDLSLSFGNYGLSYNLTCSSLPPPSQLGYRLSSALRYSFEIDKRDSPLRPTKGFALLSTAQIGFLHPRTQGFICQEVALRYAIPLGFYGAALNLGAAAAGEFSGWEEGGTVYVDRGLHLGALADLSFDLPLKNLRNAGIHGHVSANTNCFLRGFSLQSLMESLQHHVAVGVIIPTRLFRMEVNYYHSFEHGGHDRRKNGIMFSFSRR